MFFLFVFNCELRPLVFVEKIMNIKNQQLPFASNARQCEFDNLIAWIELNIIEFLSIETVGSFELPNVNRRSKIT